MKGTTMGAETGSGEKQAFNASESPYANLQAGEGAEAATDQVVESIELDAEDDPTKWSVEQLQAEGAAHATEAAKLRAEGKDAEAVGHDVMVKTYEDAVTGRNAREASPGQA